MGEWDIVGWVLVGAGIIGWIYAVFAGLWNAGTKLEIYTETDSE